MGGFLPLFYGRNDGDGSYRFMALPLLYFSHRAGKAPEDWVITPLFGVNKSPVGVRFWLGPLYVRRQDPVTSAALFPLFYYTRDDKAKTSTSFVLPLFLQTRSPERSVTMVTPLFWHERTLTRRISTLLPLMLDVHHLHSDRLTAVGPLVPLVVRYADYANKTTSWVFPPILTYVKKRRRWLSQRGGVSAAVALRGQGSLDDGAVPAVLPRAPSSDAVHGPASVLCLLDVMSRAQSRCSCRRSSPGCATTRTAAATAWSSRLCGTSSGPSRRRRCSSRSAHTGATKRATTRWCSTATTTRALAREPGPIASSFGRCSTWVGHVLAISSGACCRDFLGYSRDGIRRTLRLLVGCLHSA
jgi:hypothetical protein